MWIQVAWVLLALIGFCFLAGVIDSLNGIAREIRYLREAVSLDEYNLDGLHDCEGSEGLALPESGCLPPSGLRICSRCDSVYPHQEGHQCSRGKA